MNVVRGKVMEGMPFYIRALLPLLDGTRVMTSDIDMSAGKGWSLRIYDRNSATPGTPVYSLTSRTTASLVIFNTLQTWSQDDEGYNFQDKVSLVRSDSSGVYFSLEGGHVYAAEYEFRMIDSNQDPIRLMALVDCDPAGSAV